MRPFEHYLKSEELLEKAETELLDPETRTVTLQEAQVHATLAMITEGAWTPDGGYGESGYGQ